LVSADIIVSYDGTANDDDALALGRALGANGAELALAYVRHSREFDPRREELAQHDADRRLRTGLQLLARNDVATHVIFSASTDGGLEELAEAEGASVIVFGSDYRTAPGRAEPGNTAQRLLDGGKVAVAVAAAGRRLHPDEPIRSIGIATDDVDGSVRKTVDGLAAKLGANAAADAGQQVDLIIVGSQRNAPEGQIVLGGLARAALNASHGSVLVLPKGRTALV
jgi:nucleotide-binding universal stress UspA family protein